MFDLVIENFVKEDYVTNKVYKALYAGAIPIYYGAPNVEAVLPCKDCIINVADFANTNALAAHLHDVAKSPQLQQRYLKWRNEVYKPEGFPLFERARQLSIDTIHCRICNAVDPARCKATCDGDCHSAAIAKEEFGTAT